MWVLPQFWQLHGNGFCYRMSSGELMRFMKTFVLHLYIDSNVPDRICGDIRPLDETGVYPFKALRDFETVLLQLANKRQPDKKDSSISNSNPDIGRNL
jgi:hypothetical protein